MTEPATSRAPSADRRDERRGHFHLVWDMIYRGLRAARGRAHSFQTAVGIFLLGGVVVAVAGAFAFVTLASLVRQGYTQPFDEAVLGWIGNNKAEWMEPAVLEITFLGTALTLSVMVIVAAMFLSLTRHKYSALLLLVATGGGILLNTILKHSFDRPRPQVFAWGAQVLTSSFPSGHAMTSAVVYATVAYLAARLQERWWMRWLTMTLAMLLVLLIAGSRLFLGVHYPSDVAAGMVVGLAWAAFCMATLEAIQKIGRTSAPQILEAELPATRDDDPNPPLPPGATPAERASGTRPSA